MLGVSMMLDSWSVQISLITVWTGSSDHSGKNDSHFERADIKNALGAILKILCQ